MRDLHAPLRQVASTGIAVVPGAVALPPELLDELGGLPYREAPQDAHPVAAGSELAVLDRWAACPFLARLRADLITAVGSSVAGWQPNQVFVRRYCAGSDGMSPHRDGMRFRLLVATVSVLGSARFYRHDAEGKVTQEWPLAPGDLVLLRGKGLHGVEDGRPYHSVGGPAGEARCSVAFRMSVTTGGAGR